jgi:hypothetical protein
MASASRTAATALALGAIVAALAACAPPDSRAAAWPARIRTIASTPTSARLTAALRPMRLGARATLDFGFSFTAARDQVPPPLTEIQLRYPSNLGIALSGLGLQTCDAKTLETSGPPGCSPNAIMGYGEAFTAILLGTSIVAERAPITILRAPDEDGRLALLFYAEGTAPVDTRIVFPGLLLPSSAPFGGLVNIGVPLVPTLPGAPYISVVRLRATVGPSGVTYYEHNGGMTLAYRPTGILLPRGCPRHGFQFQARFDFLDGTHANARTAIPCAHARG